MDLKELVRRYVQQRTMLLVDNRHFEAGKEFAALRRQPSSEAKTNVVDALDFALKLINEKDAEIERLKSFDGAWTKVFAALLDAWPSAINNESRGIDGALRAIAELKADAARYQAMKNHKNQDNGDGSLTGDEVSVYRWEDGSGTGYSPDEYDALFDRLIEEQRHDQG